MALMPFASKNFYWGSRRRRLDLSSPLKETGVGWTIQKRDGLGIRFRATHFPIFLADEKGDAAPENDWSSKMSKGKVKDAGLDLARAMIMRNDELGRLQLEA
jgi:hypothetical protein